MRRLVIAIDCDDVLVPTTPFFVDAYNNQYGTNVQLNQAHSENFDAWQADSLLVEERIAGFMDTDEYRLLSPSQDAVRVMKHLAKDHELHVVTARREHEREFTRQMIDSELAGVFTSMEFVGFVGSKGQVCKRIGADVLIDDRLQHLEDAMKFGMPKDKVILFGDYPWSINDPDSLVGIMRCGNWDEVKAAIDDIAKD